MEINTGLKVYNTLAERIVGTTTYTGKTKPNSQSDPDYKAPEMDTGACSITGTFVNITWSNQQSYTPFADCDLEILVNGTQGVFETNNSNGVFAGARVGDVVTFKQKAVSPWTGSSSARLIVKVNGSDVYNNSVTVFDPVLNTYTMTIDFGNTYEVISTSTSSYGNAEMNQVFTRNNCAEGLIPTTYNYVVAANTFQAATQAAANTLAQEDINLNGQNAANANATCTVPPSEFHSYVQNLVNGRPIMSSSTGDINQVIAVSSWDNTTVVKDTLPGILYTMLNIDGNGRILVTESAGNFRVYLKSNGFVRIGSDADFEARIRFCININGAKTILETSIFAVDVVGGYTEESIPYSITYDVIHNLPIGAYIDLTIEECLTTNPNSVYGVVVIDATEMEIKIQK